MITSRQQLVVLLGICAAQILLGCADSSEVIPEEPALVTVPVGATQPKELVGTWKSDSSGQELKLESSGTAEFINHVSINAANTGGQKMDATVAAKWAAKDGVLYVYDFKSTPSVSYKWSLKAQKLVLDSGGRVKLTYSRTTDNKKK
ncbi:MAG: hypothetical protein QE269_00765 [Fimbriimonas sp.]|nr:hypothetical protein [Fimbriimonas sp.]